MLKTGLYSSYIQLLSKLILTVNLTAQQQKSSHYGILAAIDTEEARHLSCGAVGTCKPKLAQKRMAYQILLYNYAFYILILSELLPDINSAVHQ